MNVSSLNPATAQYQLAVQNGFKQRAQDFNALRNALKSNDLTRAQQALATLQEDMPGSSQTTGATSKQSARASQIDADFQALQSALQSGDLSTAQSALATLKLDMQHAGGTRRAHGRHHHEQSSGATSGTTQTSDSTASESDAESVVTALLDTQA